MTMFKEKVITKGRVKVFCTNNYYLLNTYRILGIAGLLIYTIYNPYNNSIISILI